MRQLYFFTACVALYFCLPSSIGAAPPEQPWFPKAEALPPPSGQVIRVTTVDELFEAAEKIETGGTILVADGHYRMPRYFAIKTDNVTLRGESGNRHKAILDGANSRHGELLAITDAAGVTIADLTVQNVKWNGIKINSDRGATEVTIHNCVIHNVWQRGVKAPAMPEDQADQGPRECRIQFCLFYNDRPKRFSDDQTDTPDSFNGNYIGGIDVKNTIDWRISDNVFLGIQGRTREGRGAIYISENGRGCTIERNVFIDCDIAIALGNPTLGYSPLQAIDCIVRNNFIAQCPETGILACFTRGCGVQNNTVYEPDSARGRLIWVQKTNESLRVQGNLLVGPGIQNTGESEIDESGNPVRPNLAAALADANLKAGQRFLSRAAMAQAIELPKQRREAARRAAAASMKPGIQPPEVFAAMRDVHRDFDGQAGYVAQLGDSITYSMAFWTPIGWSDPQPYLGHDDGLPKTPGETRWRDYVKGTRDKGPEHANYSGWRVDQVLRAMDKVIERDKPEVAIIMVGSNDIAGGAVPAGYRAGLEQIVKKCLDAHCVPILNTIPPRRGRDDAVEAANQIVRDIAARLKVPLADFHAECLRLRPGDSWDGTIISGDGVHPSGGKSGEYDEQNLKVCGYALRNWVNFLVYRQVYFQVLQPPEKSE